jgi:hypothetical protein
MHAAHLEYVVEGGLRNAVSWCWIRQAQMCSVVVNTKYRAKYEQSEFWCFAKEMEMRQHAEVERVSEGRQTALRREDLECAESLPAHQDWVLHDLPRCSTLLALLELHFVFSASKCRL